MNYKLKKPVNIPNKSLNKSDRFAVLIDLFIKKDGMKNCV